MSWNNDLTSAADLITRWSRRSMISLLASMSLMGGLMMSDDLDLDDIDRGLLTDLEREALKAKDTDDDTPLFESIRDHLHNQFDQRMEWVRERLQDPYERAAWFVSLGMLDWDDLDELLTEYADDYSMDEILAVARQRDLITPLDDVDEIGHDLDLDDDSDTDEYRRGQLSADWLLGLWDWVVV
jgi:hypothetical protein